MALMINKIAFYYVHARPFMHPTPIFKETYFHGIKQIVLLIAQNIINVTIIKNAVYFVYYYVISSIVLDSFRLYM